MTNREKLLACIVATLKPSSRFFAEDKEAARRHVANKTDAQVRESLARFAAINETTQAEINRNCQFAGLPRMK